MSRRNGVEKDRRGRFITANSIKLETQRLQLERDRLELTYNSLQSRSELMRSLMDPRRDVNAECGFPEEITLDHYKDIYDRLSIAARVVDVIPCETWQVQPLVYETEDAEATTPFEEAWDTVSKRLRGRSWYQDEEGSPVWEFCKRADRVSGIGQFGVMLLGFGDKQPLSEAVEGIDLTTGLPDDRNRTAPVLDLLYIRVFDQSLVEIAETESDMEHPRYGLPTYYNVSLGTPTNSRLVKDGLKVENVSVHWTRIIHIADNLDSSEFLGVPRMQQVYNHLHSLVKIYGGSGEMYWKGAFPGVAVEIDPNFAAATGGISDTEKESYRAAVRDYQSTLQRYIMVIGAAVKSLPPQIADPTSWLNTQIEAICIKLGIPVRIFKGSERGELASTQDDAAWNDRLKERQRGYVTPRIIIPLVDRLIAVGVLPEPKGYSVYWPDLDSLSDDERARVASLRADAITKLIAGNASTFFTDLSLFTWVLGMTDEEAMQHIQNKLEESELEMAGEGEPTESPLLGLVGGMTGYMEFFKAAKDGALSEEQLKEALMLFFKVDEERADKLIADGLPEPDPANPAALPGAFGVSPAQKPVQGIEQQPLEGDDEDPEDTEEDDA